MPTLPDRTAETRSEMVCPDCWEDGLAEHDAFAGRYDDPRRQLTHATKCPHDDCGTDRIEPERLDGQVSPNVGGGGGVGSTISALTPSVGDMSRKSVAVVIVVGVSLVLYGILPVLIGPIFGSGSAAPVADTSTNDTTTTDTTDTSGIQSPDDYYVSLQPDGAVITNGDRYITSDGSPTSDAVYYSSLESARSTYAEFLSTHGISDSDVPTGDSDESDESDDDDDNDDSDDDSDDDDVNEGPTTDSIAGELRGTVYDQDTSRIDDASVEIRNENIDDETDNDGRYYLSDIPEGDHTLVVSTSSGTTVVDFEITDEGQAVVDGDPDNTLYTTTDGDVLEDSELNIIASEQTQLTATGSGSTLTTSLTFTDIETASNVSVQLRPERTEGTATRTVSTTADDPTHQTATDLRLPENISDSQTLAVASAVASDRARLNGTANGRETLSLPGNRVPRNMTLTISGVTDNDAGNTSGQVTDDGTIPLGIGGDLPANVTVTVSPQIEGNETSASGTLTATNASETVAFAGNTPPEEVTATVTGVRRSTLHNQTRTGDGTLPTYAGNREAVGPDGEDKPRLTISGGGNDTGPLTTTGSIAGQHTIDLNITASRIRGETLADPNVTISGTQTTGDPRTVRQSADGSLPVNYQGNAPAVGTDTPKPQLRINGSGTTSPPQQVNGTVAGKGQIPLNISAQRLSGPNVSTPTVTLRGQNTTGTPRSLSQAGDGNLSIAYRGNRPAIGANNSTRPVLRIDGAGQTGAVTNTTKSAAPASPNQVSLNVTGSRLKGPDRPDPVVTVNGSTTTGERVSSNRTGSGNLTINYSANQPAVGPAGQSKPVVELRRPERSEIGTGTAAFTGEAGVALPTATDGSGTEWSVPAYDSATPVKATVTPRTTTEWNNVSIAASGNTTRSVSIGGNLAPSGPADGSPRVVFEGVGPSENWSTTYEQTTTDSDLFGMDSGDSYIALAGNSASYGLFGGIGEFRTVVYDSAGNLVWTEESSLTSGVEQRTGVEVDNGLVAAAGWEGGGQQDTNPAANLTLFDVNTGNIIWSDTYQPGDRAHGWSGVDITPADEVVTAGRSSESDSNFRMELVKYAADGSKLWEKQNSSVSAAFDVAVGPAGRIAIAGRSNNFYTTQVYDSDGTLLWSNQFNNGVDNGYGQATSVEITESQDVIVTGRANLDVEGNNQTSNTRFATVRYDKTGSRKWFDIHSTGDSSSAEPFALDVSSDGRIVVSGRLDDPNQYQTVVYGSNGTEYWNETFAKGLSDTDLSEYSTVAISPNGDVVTGYKQSDTFETVAYGSSTKSPAVDLDGDGRSEASVTGRLPAGTQTTRQLGNLTVSEETWDVTTAGGGVNATVELQERTTTESPTLDINGAESQTLDLDASNQTTFDSSVLQEGRNTLTVSLGESLSADAPPMEAGVRLEHGIDDQVTTEYAPTNASDRYNVTRSYGDATANATLTIPFESPRVNNVTEVEYQYDETWYSASPSTYHYDATENEVRFNASAAAGGSLPPESNLSVRVDTTFDPISISANDSTVIDRTRPLPSGGNVTTPLSMSDDRTLNVDTNGSTNYTTAVTYRPQNVTENVTFDVDDDGTTDGSVESKLAGNESTTIPLSNLTADTDTIAVTTAHAPANYTIQYRPVSSAYNITAADDTGTTLVNHTSSLPAGETITTPVSISDNRTISIAASGNQSYTANLSYRPRNVTEYVTLDVGADGTTDVAVDQQLAENESTTVPLSNLTADTETITATAPYAPANYSVQYQGSSTTYNVTVTDANGTTVFNRSDPLPNGSSVTTPVSIGDDRTFTVAANGSTPTAAVTYRPQNVTEDVMLDVGDDGTTDVAVDDQLTANESTTVPLSNLTADTETITATATHAPANYTLRYEGSSATYNITVTDNDGNTVVDRKRPLLDGQQIDRRVPLTVGENYSVTADGSDEYTTRLAYQSQNVTEGVKINTTNGSQPDVTTGQIPVGTTNTYTLPVNGSTADLSATGPVDYTLNYNATTAPENVSLSAAGETREIDTTLTQPRNLTLSDVATGTDALDVSTDRAGVAVRAQWTERNRTHSPTVTHAGTGNVLCSVEGTLDGEQTCYLPDGTFSTMQPTLNFSTDTGDVDYELAMNGRAVATDATVTINGRSITYPTSFDQNGALPSTFGAAPSTTITALEANSNAIQVQTEPVDGIETVASAQMEYRGSTQWTAAPVVNVTSAVGEQHSRSLPYSALDDGRLTSPHTVELPKAWFTDGVNTVTINARDGTNVTATIEATGTENQETTFD